MTQAYWTHCIYCGGMISGFEVLQAYPDVVVLYAHTVCHAERSPVDPDAVWNMLIEALKEVQAHPKNEHAREMAIRSLSLLGRWMKKGGLPPTVTGGDHGKLPRARSRTR
jgi:hypothetical protein